MLEKILLWLRGVIDKMIQPKSVQNSLQVDVEISSEMQEALETWSNIYHNQASWLSNEVKSTNIGAAVASEIARSTTIEMEVKIEGSVFADYLNGQMEKVVTNLREQIEIANATGGMIFKPYTTSDGEIEVDCIPAGNFYPVSFTSNGKITACVFSDTMKIGQWHYTRLEYHNINTPNGYVVKNSCFKSTTLNNLGYECSLTEVEAWAELAPEVYIQNYKKPLFAYYRYPLANNIDSKSKLGVSCYSRAVDLIRQADELWSNLIWEFTSGKRALYVDELAFDRHPDTGNPILPDRNLYRTLKLSGQIGSNSQFFEDWTPNIREENMLNGLDAIYRRIEYNCGLAYATLSNPASIDKTAEEIRSSKQRSYSTIRDCQKELKRTLIDLAEAMKVWVEIDGILPVGEYSMSYSFDDSFITDATTQFVQDMQALGTTLLRWEFRVRNYGESEETAKAKIAEIDLENRGRSNFTEEGDM